jgi:hypothetical protein
MEALPSYVSNFHDLFTLKIKNKEEEEEKTKKPECID